MRRSASATSGGAKLEDIFEQIQRGEAATLNVVVKADVQGSLEAVTESLRKLEREDVKLAFVHRAVGGITENDVALAAASNATIIGFNVRPGREARAMAAAQGVEIRTYEIIYKLIEDIQAAMVGMLAPEYEEILTGEAEVREIFRIPRIGAVAGCYVRSGVITRGPRCGSCATGSSSGKGRSPHCDASRRTCVKCTRASSAASACPTTRTCGRATSSRPTKTGKSPAPEPVALGCLEGGAAPAPGPFAERQAVRTAARYSMAPVTVSA